MEKIVLGISFSNQSSTVFKYTLSLASYFSSKVTIGYVLDYENPEIKDIYVPEGKGWREVHEEFRQNKIKKIEAFIQEHRTEENQNIPIDIDIRYGDSDEELRRLAKEQKADLLVVGKRTKTGNLFFLDTPDKIINWASCPVLLVPEDAEFHPFKRIKYAKNFILEDCESIFFFQTWLEVFQAQLVCVHIISSKEKEAKVKRKIKILRRLFPQENITFRHAIHANVEKGINRYTALSKSDLVATIRRSRTFWEDIFKRSISQAVAKDVKVPMIVFPQPE